METSDLSLVIECIHSKPLGKDARCPKHRPGCRTSFPSEMAQTILDLDIKPNSIEVRWLASSSTCHCEIEQCKKNSAVGESIYSVCPHEKFWNRIEAARNSGHL